MNAKTHPFAKSLGHLDVWVIEEINAKNKGIFIIKKENKKIQLQNKTKLFSHLKHLVLNEDFLIIERALKYKYSQVQKSAAR